MPQTSKLLQPRGFQFLRGYRSTDCRIPDITRIFPGGRGTVTLSCKMSGPDRTWLAEFEIRYSTAESAATSQSGVGFVRDYGPTHLDYWAP